MKKLLITLLVSFLILAAAGVVSAYGLHYQMSQNHSGPRYNYKQDYRVGYQRLELSQEQINEIADLKEEFYTQSETLRAKLRNLNREIRDLEFRRASYEEIDQVEVEREALLAELDEKRSAHQKEVESVLTEKQLNLIKENRSQVEEFYNEEGLDNRFNYNSHHGFGRHSRFSGRRAFYGNQHHQRGFGYRAGFGSTPGWCH